MSPGRVFALPPRPRSPSGRGARATRAPNGDWPSWGWSCRPCAPKAGRYEGWVLAGDLLFLSGQGADGWTGRLGLDLTVEQGRAAAHDRALNLLAQTRDALGSLDRVARVVKLVGFVACTPGFEAVPAGRRRLGPAGGAVRRPGRPRPLGRRGGRPAARVRGRGRAGGRGPPLALRPVQERTADGRSHSDTVVGSIVCSTPASSSAESVSRSTWSRRRALNASTVLAAS